MPAAPKQHLHAVPDEGGTNGNDSSPPVNPKPKRGTKTSNFGAGKRESHDAQGFYERFTPPEIRTDVHAAADPALRVIDRVIPGNSTNMHHVADNSVALVVTSPPYFAGKAYEEEMGSGHIPASYVEYLDMLEAVFAECVRTLEPGGRIAVNVANLGRKPYRSLAADIVRIFEKLKLLPRGEIIWQKSLGSSGSCAWGSFQSATNPVLRDITERIIIASKYRFERDYDRSEREAMGLPSTVTISRDEFMESTIDVWHMDPESANRVNHPAPFPVELPLRLINLYTFENDLVLDPFMGSGTTAVASVRTNRHFVGYDMDESYVAIANERIAAERHRIDHAGHNLRAVSLPVNPEPAANNDNFQTRAVREGHKARDIAIAFLKQCDFEIAAQDRKSSRGAEINIVASDRSGQEWYFDVSGAFTSSRGGLRRTDTLWKAIGRAAVLQPEAKSRYVLLTTDLPARSSSGAKALRAAKDAGFVREAFDMLDPASVNALRALVDQSTKGRARK